MPSGRPFYALLLSCAIKKKVWFTIDLDEAVHKDRKSQKTDYYRPGLPRTIR